MLFVAEHNTKLLSLYSCIVDMNETSHDSAVMIDNGMGRFSHGFRALKFGKTKVRDGEETGFDITKGEIMEESLVSVPANIDAETEDIILSLVEGGKLTSPIMKGVGRNLRDQKALSLPVKLDLKVTVNGQEVKCENKSRGGGGKEDLEKFTTPEEANESSSDKKEVTSGTEGDQMKTKAEDPKPEGKEKPEGETTKCPKCGSTDIKDGVCQDCGYKMEGEEKPESKPEPKEEEKKSITVKQAMEVMLTASKSDRDKLTGLFSVLDARYDQDNKVKQYLAVVGKK